MADSRTVPIVSVVSLKGGVGKTSVALGLAGAALSQMLRTVVIDLDPQSHATTVLDPGEIRFTANDVLRGSSKLKDALTPSGWDERIRVLASEPGLEQRNHLDDGMPREHLLRSAVAKLTGTDLVLIDTPPSLAQLTKNALAASDLALVVTEPTMFAVAGAHQALSAIDTVRQGFNLRLRPAGIVVNRFRSRSAENRYRVDELIAAYRDLVLDPVLPERSAIGRAQGSCMPIQGWPTPGARDVARIFRTYLDQLMLAARTQRGGPFGKGTEA